MNLKNASLLALVGTTLITALLAWMLFFDIVNVLRDLLPVVKLFASIIYAFGSFTVALFFYAFHRSQS
jgi:hypothetical protein